MIKKYLKGITATVAGCILSVMPFATDITVFANENEDVENTEEGDAGLTEEDREFWENFEWEVYDVGTYDEWQEMAEEEMYDVSAYIVYDQSGTWIQESNGRWWYRHTDGSYTVEDWERINGSWYYFDCYGYMHIGWVKYDGEWYYLGPSGAMQTGWILYKDKYYYCNAAGVMQTGWFVVASGTWYYCDETNGDWIDNTGTRMIQEAMKYVGNPYVYGGNSLTEGTDCSGYVKLISAKFDITTPRTAASQYTSSTKVSYANLQPGDLVFYRKEDKVSHVAFYVGKINYYGTKYDKGIVHAANPNQNICVGPLYGSPYGYGTYWR